MVNELWGTLSIYDHRDPIFLRSLILFDRIVIPIPKSPIGNQTQQEIDTLYRDASFLQENGAAIIYGWDQHEFHEWQAETIKEVLTVKASDAGHETRLMLQTRVDDIKPEGVFTVDAVPVYGAREEFAQAYVKMHGDGKQNLMVELSQLISIPEDKTALADIIALRNRESFQSARRALRDWQIKIMPEVLQEQAPKQVALAMEEFQQMLKRYEEEIGKGTFDKKKMVVTSVLALGALFSAAMGQIPSAIAFMSSAAPQLFSLRESMRPAWKNVRDKGFEAAGVIYEANRVLG